MFREFVQKSEVARGNIHENVRESIRGESIVPIKLLSRAKGGDEGQVTRVSRTILPFLSNQFSSLRVNSLENSKLDLKRCLE